MQQRDSAVAAARCPRWRDSHAQPLVASRSRSFSLPHPTLKRFPSTTNPQPGVPNGTLLPLCKLVIESPCRLPPSDWCATQWQVTDGNSASNITVEMRAPYLTITLFANIAHLCACSPSSIESLHLGPKRQLQSPNSRVTTTKEGDNRPVVGVASVAAAQSSVEADAPSERATPTVLEPSPPTWLFVQNRNLFFPSTDGNGDLPKTCALIFARARRLGGEGALCVAANDSDAWGIVSIAPQNLDVRTERRVTFRWAPAYSTKTAVVVGPFQSAIAYPYTAPMFWEGGSQDPPAAVFDFDGDGHAEFVHPVIVPDRGSGAAADVTGATWTYRGGRVVPYQAAATNVRAVKDLDADGRPDLLFPGPFLGRVRYDDQCSPAIFEANASTSSEHLFALHALKDGTFSPSDSVARQHVASWCGTSPDLYNATGEYDFLQRIRCARVWGVSSEEIDKALSQFCGAQSPKCEHHEKCLNMPLLRSWSKAAPPLQLTQ